ncbi:hypothetical protein FRB99_005367 [Tulasnella sp. 403]|nr:hypothetical protein FRB99_005367 [Tulasnella sp. 403]
MMEALPVSSYEHRYSAPPQMGQWTWMTDDLEPPARPWIKRMKTRIVVPPAVSSSTGSARGAALRPTSMLFPSEVEERPDRFLARKRAALTRDLRAFRDSIVTRSNSVGWEAMNRRITQLEIAQMRVGGRSNSFSGRKGRVLVDATNHKPPVSSSSAVSEATCLGS